MNNANWGAWYIVAVIAAVMAVTECCAAIALVHRPDVIAGFELAPWAPGLVTTVAILLAALVAGSTALAAVPRRHLMTI